MIELLNPSMIYLVPVVSVIALTLYILAYREKKKITQATGSVIDYKWHIIQVLKVLALILIVIASTVPVQEKMIEENVIGQFTPEELKRHVFNISALHVILVDISRSMSYKDEDNTTRLEIALDFVKTYLNLLSRNDLVMLIEFAKEPRRICIGNVSVCISSVNKIRGYENYTSITNALVYAYDYAKAAQVPAIFVIVSDGAYNYGGNPIDSIVMINKSGYPVLFVRVGLDPRANDFVTELEANNIKILNANKYTFNSLRETIMHLSWELKVDAFARKGNVQVIVEKKEFDPYPTLVLVALAAILFIASRIEGY